MANLTSSLKISLIDDVSKPAKTVAAALKSAEQNARNVAQAMSKAGATDRFAGNLAKLKLSAKDIQAVSKAWQDYAKSAGLAARSSDWTKAQQTQVRQWESNTIRALRHVKAEQSAFHRAQARAAALAATPGGGMGMGGAMTAGGVIGALRGEKFRAGAAEAASRVSPSAGYLIGAGGAVMAGAAIGGTAAAGIGAGAISIKEAIARNKAETDILKKVNLAPGETMEMKGREISAVSRKLGMNYADAASIFAQGGQAGIASKELPEFSMLAAKVATAWDLAPKGAAQSLSEIKAQTQWSIPQLQRFADKVNFLADNSAAAERDVGSMWQRASAGAKAANVSYDDSLVALTALRSVGMQEEVAARFFGQLTSRLRTATDQGKDAAAAFKDLGTSAEAVENGMKTDSMGTMVDVLTRISKSKDGVKNALGIGGKEWFDEILRAKEALPELVRLRSLLKGGGDEGSLQKALDIDLAATETKLKRAYQSILDVGAQFAKPALPWIDTIADKWISAAERMERAAERARIVAKAGAGQLTPEEQKKIDADPELKRQVQNKIWSAPKGRSISEYERQHRIGDPRKASTEEINRALPFARPNSFSRFDPQKIWDPPAAKKKRRKGPPPVPTFASGAPRPESSVLEPTPRPLPKNAPLPPRRPQMAPVTDHAPVIGGEAPAFASRTGVVPKVDASQIDAAKAAIEGLGVSVTPNVNAAQVEHLESTAEGAKQAMDGLGVSVSPNVDSAPVENLKTTAEGASMSLDGLNKTVSPHVDSSSIAAANSQVLQLLANLGRVEGAAGAAAASIGRASAAAASARASASSLPTMAQTNRGSYSAGGDPAGK